MKMAKNGMRRIGENLAFFVPGIAFSAFVLKFGAEGFANNLRKDESEFANDS
eukprot:m.162641 g.162641  ORF g.162641 m.162641 type:complete len:52 (-) comp12221_c0_seq1:276-431(-)